MENDTARKASIPWYVFFIFRFSFALLKILGGFGILNFACSIRWWSLEGGFWFLGGCCLAISSGKLHSLLDSRAVEMVIL